MKGIQQDIAITTKIDLINYDASILKIEQEKGVCVIADGKASKGMLSNKWAKYLCEKTGLNPISTINGFKYFIDHIWEDFYENNKNLFKDTFKNNAFNKYGSFSTYTACWLRQENNKTFCQWLSYGNSAVLVYDTKNDELFVPEHKNGLLGFLKNKGLVNWKEDNIEQKHLITSKKLKLTKHLKIIVASDAMAEHLVLSYLIIKSKNDDYWKKLSKLMINDKNLSNLIFNNRNFYSFNSLSDVLAKWKQESLNGTIDSYISQLQRENKVAKDDISLQVLSFQKNGKEFTTKHSASIIKTYAPKKKTPLFVPVPKPKKVPEFKNNKEAFLDVLLDHKVLKLYHFTDRSNIALIKKMGGLYSWDYMEKNNIKIPMAGGDQISKMLDARYGLQNFVRTSICSNHPMKFVAVKEGRINDPVLLEIDPIVVTFRETIFSDMNATKTGHTKGGDLEDLERINFEICTQKNHFNLDADERPYYQAEIMVKKFIPVKYITNLNMF